MVHENISGIFTYWFVKRGNCRIVTREPTTQLGEERCTGNSKCGCKTVVKVLARVKLNLASKYYVKNLGMYPSPSFKSLGYSEHIRLFIYCRLWLSSLKK